MKQKKIILAAGITIIAGAVFYYLKERNNRKMAQGRLEHLPVEGEKRIRAVMHEMKLHD